MSSVPYSPPLTLPARRRSPFSPRLVVLLALLGLPFIYFGYVIIDQAVSGGIKDRGDYLEVDLKTMGSFPFDAGLDDNGNIPEKWRKLDGKRVALVGEMYSDQSAAPKLHRFQLVYSIQDCCFGGPPRVQERVFVNAPPANPVPYYWRPVRVVGKLHVDAKRVDGQVVSVFEMDIEKMEPLG